jgi:hypothetical protein
MATIMQNSEEAHEQTGSRHDQKQAEPVTSTDGNPHEKPQRRVLLYL